MVRNPLGSGWQSPETLSRGSLSWEVPNYSTESRVSPGFHREHTGPRLSLAEGELSKKPAPALASSFHGILLFLSGCTLHPHRLGPLPTLSEKGMCRAPWGSCVGWELIYVPGKSQPSNVPSDPLSASAGPDQAAGECQMRGRDFRGGKSCQGPELAGQGKAGTVCAKY